MQKIIDLAVLAVVLATVGATVLASATQAAQLHDSQYPDVDIAHGASLYTALAAHPGWRPR